ncbi:N-acetylglucosamine-6-phosphate deacetylase [Virgibacillus kimchii]
MESVGSVYIKHATVYLEEEIIQNGSVLMKDGQITIIQSGEMKTVPDNVQVVDGTGLFLIPGFIDGHIHGANGADVMDATEEALDTIAEVLPEEGTTAFLATTITQSPENMEAALKNASAYHSKTGQAEMLGVHLEGPFIEKNKAGAQPVKYIRNPDLEQFKRWQQLAGDRVTSITMAPELDQDGSFIEYLYQSGINVSAGHTGAGFSDMKKAVDHGVRQVTHLCNAMTGIHHRDIGVVGAAFFLEELRAELIADGVHVSPEMLSLIFANMGSERLLLITDAMRAKCLKKGNYELGGQQVTVSEDRAVLSDGTLAGSILKMNAGAKQMLDLPDVTMRDIVRMTAENPAKQLRVWNRKGSIAVGKDADVLLVDEALNVQYSICRGVISFKSEEAQK